jgi:hypothetical protein
MTLLQITHKQYIQLQQIQQKLQQIQQKLQQIKQKLQQIQQQNIY